MNTFCRVAHLSVLPALLLITSAGPTWAKHKHGVAVVEDYMPDVSVTSTSTPSSAAGSASGGTLTLTSGTSYSNLVNAGSVTSAGAVNVVGLGALNDRNPGTVTLASGATLSSATSSSGYNLGTLTTTVGSGITNMGTLGGFATSNTPTFSFANGSYSVNFGNLTKNGANTLTLDARSSLGGAWTTGTPELSGSAGELKITTPGGGNILRVKTTVSISNTGTKAAKNVTADVYLSDDAVLDVDDAKLTTLKLADYFPGTTKLGKNQTLSLPIKHKLPTALASFLEGKYLIVVLNSDPSRAAGTSSEQTAASSETMVLGADGAFTSVTVADPGTNYSVAPTVTITGVPADTTRASVISVTINTGILVLNNAAGFHLPALTSTTATSFRLDPAAARASEVASLPGGTLRIAATGMTIPCPTGVALTAQAGDVLSVNVGNSLTAVTASAWELPTGQKLSLSTGATLTTSSPDAAATMPATPKNQVVIGPIKLP